MHTPSQTELRQLLDQSLASNSELAVSKAVRERLFLARRKALDAVPQTKLTPNAALVEHSVSVSHQGAMVSIGMRRRVFPELAELSPRWLGGVERWFRQSSWIERSFVTFLLVLMFASVQYAFEEAEVQILMREGETDAALLSNELPLDAYSDRGFAVFLQNLAGNGLDADAGTADDRSHTEPDGASEESADKPLESLPSSDGS